MPRRIIVPFERGSNRLGDRLTSPAANKEELTSRVHLKEYVIAVGGHAEIQRTEL
jgi:hypothetical protein